jgi:hypothetical protein
MSSGCGKRKRPSSSEYITEAIMYNRRWSFSMRVGQGANNSTIKIQYNIKCYSGPRASAGFLE